MGMISKEVEEKLLACNTVWDFNEIAIDNIADIPALNDLPKNVIEHYLRLNEEHYAEARKKPGYQESPYNHSDPREAFEKRIYKSRDEDNG